MDIFKFDPLSTTISMVNGQEVRGIKSKMWIERYREPGEFTITAAIDSDIRNILPTGTIISHIHTKELMIVENHEINDEQGASDAVITVTGRSFETILEQRAVTANKAWPSSIPVGPYTINADHTWVQALYLIDDHTKPGQVVDANDGLVGLATSHQIARSTGPVEPRVIKPGPVHPSVVEILAVENLGIRTERPTDAGVTNTKLIIHEGSDLRAGAAPVIFSFDAGDLDNADYLWSNKSDKNAVLVVGRWVQIMIKGAQAGYNRRVMAVDGSEIDSSYEAYPTGSTLTAVQNAMTALGNLVLASQKPIALSKAQAGKNSKKYLYRTDFNVGDIVTIDGEFNESASMRITEYVEIEDETGMYGYPTLENYP